MAKKGGYRRVQRLVSFNEELKVCLIEQLSRHGCQVSFNEELKAELPIYVYVNLFTYPLMRN